MDKLIQRLALRNKFGVVAIAMLVPIIVLLAIFISQKLAAMRVSSEERGGLTWASQLIEVAANLSEFTEHAKAVSGGAENERAEMLEHAAMVRAAADKLDEYQRRGDAIAAVANWKALSGQVREALEGDAGTSARQRAMRELIDKVNESNTAVADSSGLVLDPGAATYPLMSASIVDLPLGIENLASARRAFNLIRSGNNDASSQFYQQVVLARTRLTDGLHSLTVNYGSAAGADKKIVVTADALATRLDEALETLDMSVEAGGERDAGDDKLSNEVEVLTEDLTALRETAEGDLARRLDADFTSDRSHLVLQIGFVLFCLAFAGWVMTKVVRYVTAALARANGVFELLARGDFSSELRELPGDELGQLLTALGNMQQQLRARVEADRDSARIERERALANERIKQSLDSTSANVVVTDDKLNIIYVNRAAQKLMTEGEAEFRRSLPGFSAGNLVGSSFEIFCAATPQGRLVVSADQASTQEVVFGGRSLRVIANPVIDANGSRLGTIVEWVDRTPEVAAEKEIGALVSAVAEGKLEDRVSLQGKSGFFAVLAKDLNALVATVAEAVTDLNEIVHAANDGDLSRSMPLDGKAGLYVSIGSGVNGLMQTTAELVRRVKDAAAEVQTGAEEISKGNLNLSQRTEQQASSLEETASSMEEMTSTVRQTADNAGQANQLAMAARQQAEKGGSVVNAAVTAMGGINDASKKIADIIGVIDEIAFQTNLLALNAAVEAARAGEQGRGFAVVATEVRNLAGRSATAAKEIKALIQDSVARVNEGSKLVDESGRTLEEIVNAVKKVTDIVAEIAAASREQSSGIEQVNKAVMQMDQTTQQNAALVEEASAASQAIVEQAQGLNGMIARYNVGTRGTGNGRAGDDHAMDEHRSAA